jgi:hydrogenase maturation protease
MSQARGILILGVGNLLRKDDGVGVQAVQRLQRLTLPGGVTVVDGGTADVGLLDLLEGYERAVIIDAADMNLQPGSVVKFRPEATQFRSPELRPSMHSADVAGVLELARVLGKPLPELVIIGVQPRDTSWGTEMSVDVLAEMRHIVDLALEEIGYCRT